MEKTLENVGYVIRNIGAKFFVYYMNKDSFRPFEKAKIYRKKHHAVSKKNYLQECPGFKDANLVIDEVTISVSRMNV